MSLVNIASCLPEEFCQFILPLVKKETDLLSNLKQSCFLDFKKNPYYHGINYL